MVLCTCNHNDVLKYMRCLICCERLFLLLLLSIERDFRTKKSLDFLYCFCSARIIDLLEQFGLHDSVCEICGRVVLRYLDRRFIGALVKCSSSSFIFFNLTHIFLLLFQQVSPH